MYVDRCVAYEFGFVLVGVSPATPSAGGDERHERQYGEDAHECDEARFDFDRLWGDTKRGVCKKRSVIKLNISKLI